MSLDSSRTQMWVDWPQEGDQPTVRDRVDVEGWAWSPGGEPTVTVVAAGHAAQVLPGRRRPDVSDALGIGEHHGFTASASVAGVPPGPLEIVVTADGPDGVIVEQRRTVIVASGTQVRRPRPSQVPGERLDPLVDPGTLIHAEHVARYRWAAQVMAGRDVLDAACGTGYGAAILSAGGARSVRGVDASAGAVLAAREQDRSGAEFTVGDLRDLPFDDETFDAVVCFEAIEHVAADDQPRVIGELARVLRPGGVLAISTPVAGAVAVHNAHHRHELRVDELDGLLRGAFSHAALYPQHSAVASLVDAHPLAGPTPRTTSPPLTWTAGPLEPSYLLALASDSELPAPEATGTLASGFDIAGMVTSTAELADAVEVARVDATAQRARAHRAEVALSALEDTLQPTRAALEVVYSSRSWKLTRPLRDVGVAWRARRSR